MTIFTCRDTFEDMMTCIYEAWASRLGHNNVRLELEPVMQQELFCDYIHVEGDPEKSAKVASSVSRKISSEAYRQMYLASCSCAPEKLDVIYRFLILGFHVGRRTTEYLTEDAVIRLMELSRKAGNESHYFREFTRFTSIDGKVYVAHIEPKCNILSMTASHFADRMPSEYWIMIDDKRHLAAVHPKNEPFYLRQLEQSEWEELRKAETYRDSYTDLWQEFFDTIAIKERINPRCQRNMMPLWYRKHATEFIRP